MRQSIVSLFIALALAFVGASREAAAEAYGAVAAPIYQPGLQHEFYVGYQTAEYDYGLVTSAGVVRAVSSGFDTQFRYHASNDHLALVGTARYSSGTLLGQKLSTAAAGLVYVAPIRSYAPFVQVLGGVAHMSSTDTIYLQTAPQTGLAALFGAGLDVNLGSHWGVRPVYVEYQYLPSFGPKGSVYWNAGAGLVYHFNSFGPNR
jgi:hypothetical protein